MKQKKRGTMRTRWMSRTVAAVSAVLIVVFVLFLVFVTNYYYSTIRTGLAAKAKTATGFFC